VALIGMNRLEALSDGVFAFAIAILVLGLSVPLARGKGARPCPR
jgi:uncharacterized membrane protein